MELVLVILTMFAFAWILANVVGWFFYGQYEGPFNWRAIFFGAKAYRRWLQKGDFE